jgi:hypothetical protein
MTIAKYRDAASSTVPSGHGIAGGTMGAESGFVEVDGTRMYWEGRGSGGTPLLLVHGGYGHLAGVVPGGELGGQRDVTVLTR